MTDESTETDSVEARAYRIVIAVEGTDGKSQRVYRIRRSLLRWVAAGFGVAALLGAALVASWGSLASEARRAASLEAEVARLSSQEAQVARLALELDSIASAYEDIRSFFGSAVTPGTGDLWLPPSAARPSTRALPASDESTRPSEWPLTQVGFLTRSAAPGGTEDHPGIDIAVPNGSYVRSAGAGRVFETGEDEVYGSYVIVDHGDGYRSLYGHASLVLATPGNPVRRGEVIALSGSSGSSTAPHLHFEILEDGTPLDPLDFLEVQ